MTEEESVEVKFISRPELTIQTLPSKHVDIVLENVGHQLPGIALSIIEVFTTARTIEEGTDVLLPRMTDSEERTRLNDTISQMLRARILMPEGTEAGESVPDVSSGYAAPKIHVQMLRDDARTLKYLAAIREYVRPGDVVLDIGTGTGVLAVAAAEAGARQVYAIEANSGTARFAEALIAGSPCRDKIKLIQAWSTEARLPERCDLLVSEMIGNDPLDEAILSMTADAISRHLKPTASLIPSRLDIFAQAVRLPRRIREEEFFCEQDVSTWKEKYGLNFSPLLSANPRQTLTMILPQKMKEWDFVGTPRVLSSIDLAQSSQAVFDERFEFELGDQAADGVVIYFETTLSKLQQLSTEPTVANDNNHWLTPCHVFRSEFRDRLSIGYRYGISNEMDGVYLIDSPPTD